MIAIVIAVANVDPVPLAHPKLSAVTWTTDVGGIIERRCVGCHVTGGFGPMSLATYDEARNWAKEIREAVLERRMPPWPAARGFGDFANDRSLTPIEVELLAAWAEGGTPLGPPTPRQIDGTGRQKMRAPDIVLNAPAVRVQKPRERLELANDPNEARWLAGWEFNPGNASLVEQAILTILPDTVVGTWVPGDGPVMYPVGVARHLPAGTRLAVDVQYKKSTDSALVRSTVGLYFGQPPRHELERRSFGCGITLIDRDVDAISVRPLSTETATTVEVVARRPDSTVEPLIVVLDYQPRYLVTYRFRQAVRLPRGTTLDIRSSAESCGADLEFFSLTRAPVR